MFSFGPGSVVWGGIVGKRGVPVGVWRLRLAMKEGLVSFHIRKSYAACFSLFAERVVSDRFSCVDGRCGVWDN